MLLPISRFIIQWSQDGLTGADGTVISPTVSGTPVSPTVSGTGLSPNDGYSIQGTGYVFLTPPINS